LPQPSVFFAADLYREVGGIDVGVRHMIDLDLWLRMLRVTRLVPVPRLLSQLRQHDAAKTTALELEVHAEVWGLIERELAGVPRAGRRRLRRGYEDWLCAAALRRAAFLWRSGRRGRSCAEFFGLLRGHRPYPLVPLLARELLLRLSRGGLRALRRSAPGHTAIA
jgi:hypothetical protein